MDNNVIWHHATVTRDRREKMNGHRGAVIWFTGLSGSGKSTLAHEVEEALHQLGCHTFVFDGDNVRHGLCSDLGFSEADRVENIRRIGEMVNLFTQAGVISLTAFISPFTKDRQRVRDMFSENIFVEIFCKCTLAVCEKRDKKGLYKLARAGKVKDFTGISSPYEEPENAELVVNTDEQSLEESVKAVVATLQSLGIIQVNT